MYNAKEFCSKLLEIAAQPTIYAKGCFGDPLKTAKDREHVIHANSYNQSEVRKKVIGEAPAEAHAFDCSGLIKGVLWGYNGSYSSHGGAVYKSNSVPDIDAAAMILVCKNVSADFSTVDEGEFIYMKGHCGIYVGGGRVVESTPKWADGVQVTQITDRRWLKHGYLPYITYQSVSSVIVARPTLKKGNVGMQVYNLQRNLNLFGHDLKLDGIFGKKTDCALKIYQAEHLLAVDGIYGARTYKSMREEVQAIANKTL